MTPQQLKNSILQQAIEGKLVEQRPEEGTGEELYQQIQKEKQKLIKEGKIKKEKPLPPITEDEIPFEIPESWKWVHTGDIGSWGSGATPSKSHSEYYGGDIPWLVTGDLNDGIISEIPGRITEEALQKTSVRLNPAGSVLMAMYGATIGKLGILAVNSTTNQACCACQIYDGVFNKYLFYYLMARRKYFTEQGAGSGQPNISKQKIVESVFALPPLSEQQRIVAKIEELLPYIDQYEQAYNRLESFNKKFPDDMKKSILQMAVEGKLVEQRPEEGTGEELYQQIQKEKQKLIKEGKIKKEKPLPPITEEEIPFEIPKSWKWVRIKEIARIEAGGTPSRSNSDYWQNGTIPWVKIGDIAGKYVEKTSECITEEGLNNSTAKVFPKGTLLYTIFATIGNVAILNIEAATNQAIVGFEIYGHLNIDYLYYVLLALKDVLISKGHGMAQMNINQKILKSTCIPLPPLAEQKRIAAKVEELLPLCDRLKEPVES